jgi:hypothetical protein
VRLSDRLKTLFPRLPILLLLDGLYANGPVMRRCLRAHWQFMIVLKDKDTSLYSLLVGPRLMPWMRGGDYSP